jgi:uncharacterized membrane protein YagU involved in acid resistance
MGKFPVPKAILWAGLIAGTLDITAACIDVGVNFDKDPVWLLQNVASSLLGPRSYAGGLATAALGLLMHFTVAYTVTTVFYLLSRRWPVLLRWAVPSGLVYGALVFLVMYRVVIPLTIGLKSLYLTTAFNHNWPRLRWSQLFGHFLCIGLPIALVVRWLSPVPPTGRAT